jgi:type III secretory pathway component EscU
MNIVALLLILTQMIQKFLHYDFAVSLRYLTFLNLKKLTSIVGFLRFFIRNSC